MEVVLEPIEQETDNTTPTEPTPTESTPIEVPSESPLKEKATAKRRGRPVGSKNKIKQTPPEPEHNSDDERLTRKVATLNREDIEGSILSFLNNRHIERQHTQRQLWSSLASTGLR